MYELQLLMSVENASLSCMCAVEIAVASSLELINKSLSKQARK